VNKGTWISISAHPGKKLFKKEWRDSFARVLGAPECSTALVMVEGINKFPFC